MKQTRTAIEADKNRRNKRRKPNPEPEQPQKPPREPRALLAYGQNDLPGNTTCLYPRRGTVEENADFIPLETDSVGDSDHISIIIDGSPTNPSGSNALNQPFESTGLRSSPPYFFFDGTGDGGSDTGNDSNRSITSELPGEWFLEEQ